MIPVLAKTKDNCTAKTLVLSDGIIHMYYEDQTMPLDLDYLAYGTLFVRIITRQE